MDIVAPSAHQSVMNITVVDLPADSGFNTSSNYIANLNYPNLGYTKWFGGTSASCAQASGVAALMLSYRPDLTEAEVRNYIVTSAVDLGNPGFDNEFGHGMLNAYNALVAISNVVLPVAWGEFSGQPVEDGVQVQWNLLSENTLVRFQVEKQEGNRFVSIGEVAGSGIGKYSFLDTRPHDGMNVYRIRQIDIDGTSQFSSLIEVSFAQREASMLLNVYPNPVKDVLNVEVTGMPGQTVQYEILDMQGRRLAGGNESSGPPSHHFGIQVQHLQQGLYVLKISGEHISTMSRKFLVE
jgi:hypothetical protein